MAKIKLKIEKLEVLPKVNYGCPECESETLYVRKVLEKGSWYWVECKNCKARSYRYQSAANAIRDFPMFRGLPTVSKARRKTA